MWQFIRSRILTAIIFIGAAHGVLVVGPKFIRSNQPYNVVVSNFNDKLNKVNLMLRMEGQTDDGTQVLNKTEMFDVRRFANKMVTMNMPENLRPGHYKITIDGMSGFSFHKEAELVYQSKSISAVVQLNKPVFKPGDKVQFRVIVLDTELKPPSIVKSVQVTIRDPQSNKIRSWSMAKLHAGVFEGDLDIAPTPMLGIWNISVQLDGEELASKTFEVKEYVLSSFDVQIIPTITPVQEDQALTLTIVANYYFGKPVKGSVAMELYLDDDKLDQKKQFEMDGKIQQKLTFNDYLDVMNDKQNVRLKLTFTERHTNRTVTKIASIPVYKYPYHVELVKDSPQFRPGHPFKCALKFTYHNGTLASGITGKLDVYTLGYEETATSNNKGLIEFVLHPRSDTEIIDVNFAIDENGFFYDETVNKVEAASDAYLKLELKSSVKVDRALRILVKCSEQMSFFVYYVLSKGNIIDSSYIRPNKQASYMLPLKATEKMIPKTKILVITVANNIVVYDSIDLDFEEFRNNFDLSIDEDEIRPGRQIELSMRGRPRAYVGLASYDAGLLAYGKNHDLYWEDIVQLFNGFHDIDENEFDKIHSMGLFARTLDGYIFDGANDKSARDGSQSKVTKLVEYRTNFLESWLWKNVTIGRQGTRSLIEVVPDTTTTWYLTGFSIDPTYGLGIIKKPIQFTTVQPFYIVDSLPYSIKRGEAVVLQFTLFNNLGAEYVADVTLFNVAEQMEFVGRPLEDVSYTKPVTVPPNVGVPVSFLVKARKLGELAVRVKASIMLGLETDAIEKVIRVLPESLLLPNMMSNFFSFDEYKNQTFLFNLDINKKADKGSEKITFRVNPNLLSSVIENLDHLLAVPTGCGEQNMVKFVPNIVALDYLTAIGSKQTTIIDKATNMLRQGYQNQMRYRQSDGSFGVWQTSGGSVFLTAFVAKSMQTASKYIDVDKVLVETAYAWLASKQQPSGRFDETGSVIHRDMQGGLRNGIALTSYVLTALLEHHESRTKYAPQIQRALGYLNSQFNNINDHYDMSIATYALMLGKHTRRNDALKKLITMSTPLKNETERYWNTDNKIEATAYALLSFVAAEKFVDGIPLMRWLVNQRFVTGSFPRTQDTFVGLKALTALAEKISPSRNDYSIQVTTKKQPRHYRITSLDISTLEVEDLPQDTRKMEVNVGGLGFGLLEVVYEYTLNLQNFSHRFNLTLEKIETGSDYELQLQVCTSFLPKLTTERSNMALVEVNFPSGYVADSSPISKQTTENPIQNIELRYGSTSVVVYYNNMGTERNCFTVTAYRRFKVALVRPAYVIVYDYYHADLNAIKVYEVFSQKICDLCEKDSCPDECSPATVTDTAPA